MFTEHKMTNQIERTIDAITGEMTERELTQAEIDALTNATPHGSNE
jgi:hypothetical protein